MPPTRRNPTRSTTSASRVDSGSDSSKGPGRCEALAKRVTSGAREHLTQNEWAMLVEVYMQTKGLPGTELLNELGRETNRCPKKLSIWFGNRRQDVAKKSIPPEGVRAFLWTKRRLTGEERKLAQHSSSTPNLSDCTPPPSRASSTVAYERPAAEVLGVSAPPVAAIRPGDCAEGIQLLLAAANYLESLNEREACEGLLALRS